MKLRFSAGIVLTLILSLSACAVGPDFIKPTAPVTASYAAAGDSKNKGTQKIVYGERKDLPWWEAFRSAELNHLVALGVKNNYSLVAMQETLAEAKEKVNAQIGQLFPQMSLNANAGREKYGVALFGPSNITIAPFTYYELGPSANFMLDFFGGTRRSIEKEQALATYQQEEFNAAYLTLTGNIASTVVTIATINKKIEVTKEIIREDNKNLKLVQEAFRLGSSTQTEVLSAESQQENDETLLPALYQQLAVAKDLLSVLTGTPPANWDVPEFKLTDFYLPRQLTLIFPSELAHKRPDILAAEAMLHAANADIGIATANLYPSVNLSASRLQEALSPGNLFKSSATAWSLLGGVSAPIFNGGTLRAEKRAAMHAYQSSYANYQQVVLKAFAQVNDILQALRHDEETVVMARRAVKTAAASLRLARLSYNAGNVGILQILEAERLYTQARLSYVQADGQRYQDTAQLSIVLGG